MLEFLKREVDFIVSLWNTAVPTILAMKPYIDEMMEIPIIKAISICGSIAGAICLLPRLPKIINKLIRKISTWGRY